MPETTVAELLTENGITHTHGKLTNRTLEMDALLRAVREVEQRRLDIVAARSQVKAVGDPFGIKVDGDARVFSPTPVALKQVADHTRIPLEFLRNNVGKYPELAANMVNTWLKDNDAGNRMGTSRARKNTVVAEHMKQLFRLLVGTNNVNVFRAMLSSKYMILDNSDVLASVLQEVQTLPAPPSISGSLTDEKMYVRMKMPDISATISFPGKGKGHERVYIPCGASLLLQGSDVGLGRTVVCPELEVITCSNLMRSTEALAQIHLGQEYADMGALSRETLRKMNMAMLGRVRDVTRTLLTADTFQRVADLFSENAGKPVENARAVVENVTAKFSLSEETGKSVLDRFIEEGMGNRFGLAQAITFQAHAIREDDFEGATHLEDIGSKILTMPEKKFQAELVQV